MAETLAHHPHRHAGGKSEGRMGVTEIVEPDSGESRPGDQAIEPLCEQVRVEAFAPLICEHQR